MGSGYLHPYGAPRHFDTDEEVGRSPNHTPPSKNNQLRTARAWKRAERRRARETAWDGWELAPDSLGQNDEAHTKEE